MIIYSYITYYFCTIALHMQCILENTRREQNPGLATFIKEFLWQHVKVFHKKKQ